jgi:hypothetical protein
LVLGRLGSRMDQQKSSNKQKKEEENNKIQKKKREREHTQGDEERRSEQSFSFEKRVGWLGIFSKNFYFTFISCIMCPSGVSR